KIKTTKNDLLSALQTVERGASTRSVLPSLGGVLLETRDGALDLRCTDTAFGIANRLESVEVVRDGTALVYAQVITNIARSLPDGEVTMSLSDHGSGLDLVSNTARFTVRVLNKEAFPPEPAVEGEQTKITAAPFV